MGLRLPIYPYCVAQGKEGVRADQTSHHNKKALSLLKRFEEYLCQPEMRNAAINVIPPQGKKLIPKKGWFKAPVFDEDVKDHTGLAKLMQIVRKSGGTIVIPHITHIVGTKESGPPSPATRKLMVRFDEEDIELLPLVIKTEQTSYDFATFVENGKPAPELFGILPEAARFTVRYLKHSALTRNASRNEADHRQLPAVRTQV